MPHRNLIGNPFRRVDQAWRDARRRVGFKLFGLWEIGIALFSLLLVAFLWAFAVERVRHEERQATDVAIQHVHTLTRVFEAQTVKTLKGVEVDLALIAHEYLVKGRVDFANLLASNLIAKEVFLGVGILDERGKLVVSSNERIQLKHLDLSSREYFAILKNRPGNAVYVGAPIYGGITESWVIPVARRLEGPQGEFKGVVAYGIDPSYFIDFYRREDLKEDGVVTLLGTDGITRARRAGGGDSFGEDARRGRLLKMYKQQPVGDFISSGSLDGVSRFQSYRKLADYDLIVSVGLSVNEVLKQAREREHEYLGGAMVGSILVLLFAVALLVAIWRRRLGEAHARMQDLQRQAILDNIEIAWFKDAQSRFLAVNKAFAQVCNRTIDQIIGKTDYDIFPAHTAQAYRADDIEVMRTGQRKVVEEEIAHADGAIQTIETIKSCVRDAEGAVIGTVGTARDITERRHAEADSRLAAKAFESIAEGIMVTDANKRVISVNKAFSTITGYAPEEVLGLSPKLLQSGRHDAAFYAEMWKYIDENGFWHGEIWDRRKNGEIFPELLSISAVVDQAGKVSNYVGVFTDISSLKRYEEKLHYQAQHDALTGLPNRFQFQERFSEMLSRANRQDSQVAVMVIDLDRFKNVNDSFGHAAGDELLQQTAERLKSNIRQSDIVGRFGGDEFSVLLDNIGTAQNAAVIAQKLLNTFTAPFVVAGHEIYVSGSIGISCYPADATDAENLFKNADVAMYRAKAEGRNRYQFFSADMNARALENLLMSSGLRLALERKELFLHYQPRIDLSSGRISGAEALIRWQHPGSGLVSPACFIPIAEEMGLIEPIDEWVLKEACRQMRQWLDAGVPLSNVAVNLSARQFSNPDLSRYVADILGEAGLDARHLEIEVTESMVMQHPENVVGILTRLKEMGVAVAIDDFGTGYSSLSYLKRFPIDFLKIDQSFIKGIPQDLDDVAIASAIIALAKSLNVELIAEGVETEAQLDFLRGQGCHNGQGYLFSKPIPPAELERLLSVEQI
ncbi:MAG TPA: EAL domain-containing protein [Burkholderiales bacterium]|nr:EAL domain-containing protein [Burkholderiales bacterium]